MLNSFFWPQRTTVAIREWFKSHQRDRSSAPRCLHTTSVLICEALPLGALVHNRQVLTTLRTWKCTRGKMDAKCIEKEWLWRHARHFTSTVLIAKTLLPCYIVHAYQSLTLPRFIICHVEFVPFTRFQERMVYQRSACTSRPRLSSSTPALLSMLYRLFRFSRSFSRLWACE